MSEIEWTHMRRGLLEWLSKEDDSALGECHGSDLSVLVNAGLAKISGPSTNMYSRVSLTDAGHDKAKALREATP